MRKNLIFKLFYICIFKLIKYYLKIVRKLWINRIITYKKDYCVIYSIEYEEEIAQKLYSKFKRNNDLETDIYNIENIEEIINNYDSNINNDVGHKIIFFYFLFICNEENNQNYNFENTNINNY